MTGTNLLKHSCEYGKVDKTDHRYSYMTGNAALYLNSYCHGSGKVKSSP